VHFYFIVFFLITAFKQTQTILLTSLNYYLSIATTTSSSTGGGAQGNYGGDGTIKTI